MGMFNIREPRRFEHKYIYYDERKERLAQMAIVLIVLLGLLLHWLLTGKMIF